MRRFHEQHYQVRTVPPVAAVSRVTSSGSRDCCYSCDSDVRKIRFRLGAFDTQSYSAPRVRRLFPIIQVVRRISFADRGQSMFGVDRKIKAVRTTTLVMAYLRLNPGPDAVCLVCGIRAIQ